MISLVYSIIEPGIKALFDRIDVFRGTYSVPRIFNSPKCPRGATEMAADESAVSKGLSTGRVVVAAPRRSLSLAPIGHAFAKNAGWLRTPPTHGVRRGTGGTAAAVN